MLTFNRPSFRSGTMVLKVDVGEPATELGWVLRPSDKGTNIDFAREGFETAEIETALLAKYPLFLSVPA